MYYMRQILNISLPEKMAENIRHDVKDGEFSSVSEFMRAAVRFYRTEVLLHKVRKSEKEFKEGKTKTITSFTELRK